MGPVSLSLDSCTCHLEGTSPSKPDSCQVENKVEGTMVTLTWRLTKLFVREESVATDQGKERSEKPEDKSLFWLLPHKLCPQTSHTSF